MRTISNTVIGLTLLAALALAGCGSGGSSGAAPRSSKLRSIALTSTAVTGGGAEKVGHDLCRGGDVSIPLSWSALPADTREVLLLMLAVKPAGDVDGRLQVSTTPQWAVAGLPPTARRLASGRLPHGAIVGRAAGGSSYPVCPAGTKPQLYAIMVFASPQKLPLRSGFTDDSAWAELNRVRPPYGQLLVELAHA